MKRFLLSAAVASMMLGSAGFAMAQSSGSGGSGGSSSGSSSGSGSSGAGPEKDGSPGIDRGQGTPQTMNSSRVQDLLNSKGYNNVSSVQNSSNGRIQARAMKNGKPVTLEIDPQTGNVVEMTNSNNSR
jgi:hypothetical protein